jgi:hypothetical protein
MTISSVLELRRKIRSGKGRSVSSVHRHKILFPRVPETRGEEKKSD